MRADDRNLAAVVALGFQTTLAAFGFLAMLAGSIRTARAAGGCNTTTTTTTTRTTTTTIALFDLGHTAEITSLQEADSRLLSQDQTAHWVLWDLSARRAVREGDDGQAALAGTTLAVAGGGLLRVHDATTGALRFSIPASPSQFGVAQDGSYVW